MALFKSSDKFLKWRYHIAELIILYSKKKEEKLGVERLKSLSIYHDYENNLFPIFKMELVLESDVYYDIIKDKKNIKIKLRLQKYNTETGSEEKSLMKDYINKTFDLILDDDDYDTNESIRKEENIEDMEKITQTNRNDLREVDNVIEFFLFDSSLVNKFNKNVNEIIPNGTPLHGIQYIMGKVGIKQILMTPPDNTRATKELVIPFMKAKEAIRWIDTYYGLYKSGMLFYSDFISGVTYILKYSASCTAWRNNEIRETDILVPEKSSKYSSDPCMLKRKEDKEKNYIVGDNSNISIRNESISSNTIAGSGSMVFDPEEGTMTASNSDDDDTNDKTSVMIANQTENPYYNRLYTSLTSGKHLIIETTMSDYDADVISPNKRFKVLFENSALAKKYNGNFIISSIAHNFTREGADFTLSSTVKFKELKDKK